VTRLRRAPGRPARAQPLVRALFLWAGSGPAPSPKWSPRIAATATRSDGPNGCGDAAAGWDGFWEGRLDLGALAWEVAELLENRLASAAAKAVQPWRENWPGDLLRSVPSVGEICAAGTRARCGDGQQLRSAKAAAGFIGLNPSNWELGLTASPSRPVTKEGSRALCLAY
jgi:Transposase IS116/IS110/IS902 family